MILHLINTVYYTQFYGYFGIEIWLYLSILEY